MTERKTKTKDFEIIDSHAHIYPDKIAEKASVAISNFYDIEMLHHGSTKELLEEGKSAGISRFLVHSVATTAEQVHRINLFLLSEITTHSEFIGFMSLHPDMEIEDMKREVEFGIENGFKGIKLHPDFQRFHIDGKRAEKIYEAVDGRLPILVHAGDYRYDFSKPSRVSNALKMHPNQTLICAHFGGWSEWEDLSCYKGLDNAYFDTCSSLYTLDKEKAVEIIREFGADKFFFGTDYPMWDAGEELERFFALQLTDEERQMILSKNLINFLKL